jgi:hypothetical protein
MPGQEAKPGGPISGSRGGKRKRRHSTSTPQAIARHERNARVVELRRSGMTFDAIARIVGLADGGAAYRVFKEFLNSYPIENVDEARALDVDRLDMMLQAIWWRVLDPEDDKQMWATDRAIKIVELQSKIKGTVKPVRQEVHVLTESTVDAAIAALQAQSAARALAAGVELPALPATAEVVSVERLAE